MAPTDEKVRARLSPRSARGPEDGEHKSSWSGSAPCETGSRKVIAFEFSSISLTLALAGPRSLARPQVLKTKAFQALFDEEQDYFGTAWS